MPGRPAGPPRNKGGRKSRNSDCKEGNMAIIRALAEADLPEARRILQVAFGTFLGAPDPEHLWSDLDYVYGRFGAEHTAAFAAEGDDGAVVGSNFRDALGQRRVFRAADDP